MKTKVELRNDDQQHNDYKKGEVGYIDGWVRGGDGAPYACVVIGEKIIMCRANEMRVLQIGLDLKELEVRLDEALANDTPEELVAWLNEKMSALSTDKASAPTDGWRGLLWVRHGCGLSDLYGDDGEMQCGQCGIDFKRWTPEQMGSRWEQLAMGGFVSKPTHNPEER